jgi:anti-sigma B factor antagonist
MAEYRTESLPDAFVVEVRGEIDISNVAELSRRVLQALADGETAVVLDLYNVTHLDSSGLAAVISANQHLQEVPGGKLALVLEPRRLRRTFELRGLEEVFVITESREAALEALRDPGSPAIRPLA